MGYRGQDDLNWLLNLDAIDPFPWLSYHQAGDGAAGLIVPATGALGTSTGLIGPAISLYVQTPYVGAGAIASGTTSCTPSRTNTAGNLLVLLVAWDGTTNVPATPSGWTLGVANTPAGVGVGDAGTAIFYILSSAGGTINPTVTVTGAADVYAQISEYSSSAAWTVGTGSSAPLGNDSGNATVTSITTSALTPPQARSLVVSVFAGTGNTNSDTITPSSTGPTMNVLGSNVTGGTTMDFEDSYQVTTTTSTFTATWTMNASVGMSWAAATFKWTPSGSGGTTLTPSVGSLGIAGSAPTQAVTITPSVGSLTLEYALRSQVVQPSVGSLGVVDIDAPIVTQSGGGVTITPSVGSLGAVGLTVSEGLVDYVPTGALIALGNTPALSYTYTIVGATGSVTVAGAAPLLAQSEAPSPATLTLTGYAATIGYAFATSAGSLAFIGAAPQLAESEAPSPATLVLTGYAPVLNLRIAPSVASLSFAAIAPTLQMTEYAGVGALAFVGYVAVQNITVTVNAGALALTGNVPGIGTQGSIVPNTGALSLSDIAISSLGIGVAPSAGALGVSSIAPTETLTTSPNAAALALTGTVPKLALNVVPGAGALNITSYAPANAGTDVPSTAALALTGNAPTIVANSNVIPFPVAAALTGNAPSLVTNSNVVAAAAGAAFLGFSALLAAGTVDILPTATTALIGYAPTLIQGTVLTPNTGTLAAIGVSPLVSNGGGNMSVTITPSVGSLTLEYALRSQVVQPNGGALWLELLHTFPANFIPVTGALSMPEGDVPIQNLSVPSPLDAHAALQGYAPTVRVGSQSFITPSTGSVGAVGTGGVDYFGTVIVLDGVSMTFVGNVSPISNQAYILVGTLTGSAFFSAYAPQQGVGVSLNVAQLALSGASPNLLQQLSITPNNVAMTIQGAPSTINLGTTPSSAAALALTGIAPQQGLKTAPNAAALTLIGNLPVLATGGTIVGITPSTGALNFTGFAPSIITPAGITTGTGALNMAGVAPTLNLFITLTIGTGSMNFSLYTAIVAQTPTIVPPTGALGLLGAVPSRVANATLVPSKGILGTFTGYAEITTQQYMTNILTGPVAFSASAPVVTQNADITPSAGAMCFHSDAQGAVAPVLMQPSSSEADFVGNAPTVVINGPPAVDSVPLVLSQYSVSIVFTVFGS